MILKDSIQIKKYDFKNTLISKFQDNHFINGFWPLVYILSDTIIKEAYVGETTDACSRISNHLKNNIKNKLTVIHLIASDKFNKSATLDIESNLIKYLAGDGEYKLLNGNLGLANHTYYQKNEIYWDIFKTIWSELKLEGITKKTLDQINNSDLFKYSPYKSLSVDQKASIIEIIKCLIDKKTNTVVVEGGAGTGKSILAIFLFKLLNSDIDNLNLKEFESEEEEFINLVRELKNVYPNPSMALVVPMQSFRSTLKKIFKNIKDLNARMVIGPSEVVNQKFDILIVDESHRLRKRVNLGTYFGAFDKANEKLKLDKLMGNELDWILKQSKKNIFFYDENQSIKPSDVNKKDFDLLKSKKNTSIKKLYSQFRVRGGNDYITYVDKLLNCNLRKSDSVFKSKQYELSLFNSLDEMVEKIREREEETGLSRLVAGYSWEWVSKKSNNYDIKIDNIRLKWNSVKNDWVNSKNSINEVGCIHTTQGYDLNYTGIIFGNEISYDKESNQILILEENYFDKNGKQSIKNPNELKEYIINIYKTIMLRGIKGTYVYACDNNLRDYLSRHINLYENAKPFTILPFKDIKPFINCVPLYNLKVAAGSFSDLQKSPDLQWVELPKPYKASEDFFVCQVYGESMNKVIPSGSWCLFKKDPGGSRKGKIVLVQHNNIQDSDFGSGYTVKSYDSKKTIEDDNWFHETIILRPLSNSSEFSEIVLKQEELNSLKIIGIFVCVL